MLLKKTLLNFSFFLFCLIPLALVTGPFLPDLFLSLISLIYLFFFFKKDEINHTLKISIYIGFIFYFLIVLSSFFSEIILISLKSSFFYFRFLLFLPAIIYILKNKKNFVSIFLLVLLITCIFVIFDSYFQYFNGKNILGFKPLKIGNYDLRITGLFGDDEILGSYLSKILPILISILYFSQKKNKEIISILLIVIFGISIFISSERSAFIHYLMFSLIFFLLSSIDIKKKLMILILIPIIFLITQNDDGKKHRMVISIINSIKTIQFSTYHSDHYKTSYNMFLDRKFIGHGPKSFRYLCSDNKYKSGKYSCSTHPHNTYLQLLSETGVFGFFIIFSIFCYFLFIIIKIFIFKYFKKKKLHSDAQISICIGIFVYLWPISPHGNFFGNWLSVLLFMQLAVFYLSFSNNSGK